MGALAIPARGAATEIATGIGAGIAADEILGSLGDGDMFDLDLFEDNGTTWGDVYVSPTDMFRDAQSEPIVVVDDGGQIVSATPAGAAAYQNGEPYTVLRESEVNAGALARRNTSGAIKLRRASQMAAVAALIAALVTKKKKRRKQLAILAGVLFFAPQLMAQLKGI